MLSLSTKMNIDAVEIYNRAISGFNRASVLILCVASNLALLNDVHGGCAFRFLSDHRQFLAGHFFFGTSLQNINIKQPEGVVRESPGNR